MIENRRLVSVEARTMKQFTVVVALLAFLAGCGGGDDKGTPAAGDPSPEPVHATVSPVSYAGGDVASCYAGEGTSSGKKLYATLRMVRTAEGALTGTYVVGETKVGGLPYSISAGC